MTPVRSVGMLRPETRGVIPKSASESGDRPLGGCVKVPRHIAIIMDGNGRWASERNLPRWDGHREGAKRVRPVVEHCIDCGVKALTLYAFSVQNWGRPEDEIGTLMGLLTQFIALEKPHLIERGVRVHAIGELSRLPPDAEQSIHALVTDTAQNTEFELTICLSYGGREELVRSMQRLARKVQSGVLAPDEISEGLVERHLDVLSSGRSGPGHPNQR